MDATDLGFAVNPFPGLRAFHPNESDVFFGRRQQIDDLLLRLGDAPLVAVAGSSGCGKSSLVLAGLLNALARRYVEGGPIEWRPVVMRPGSEPIARLARALAAALRPAAPVAAEPAPGSVSTTLAAVEGGAAPAADAEGDAATAAPAPPIDEADRAAALAGRLCLGGTGLAEAVRVARLPAHVRVLVVVDQFEELFRYGRMAVPDECTAFVKLLLHAANSPDSPVNVVLTMRSDWLGHCADFRDLPEAVSRGQFLVPRLTREQRKQAIVGPVEQRGYRIAPRLVQRVLNDVSDDFDDLPVMQHALACTWRRWAEATQGGRPIDIEDYEAVGTAARALSDHANQAYDSLPGLGAVVEHVFRALTERIGSAGSEVRRPLPFEQLCRVTAAAPEQVAAVVDRYRRADTVFLLPPPDTPLGAGSVIDISHESLIRGWNRLAGWACEEAIAAQTYRRIAEAAKRFDEKQDGLLRDPALQFALEWRDQRRPTAAWAELYQPGFERAMAFLDQSHDARTRLRQAAERKRRRDRRITVVVFGMVAGGAVVMGVLWKQAREATTQAQAATARAEASQAAYKRVALDLVEAKAREQQGADSRRLAFAASNALVAGRIETALLLGAASLQGTYTAEEAQEIMRKALLDAPSRILERPAAAAAGAASADKDALTSLVFSPDGSRLASASKSGRVTLWGRNGGAPLATVDRAVDVRHDAIADFAADGALVVSPEASGAASVVDAAGRAAPRALAGAQEPFPNADASAPGARSTADGWTVSALDARHGVFAAASMERGLRVWDLASGAVRAALPVRGGELTRLVFGPDGKTLAVARKDGVLVVDIGTARPSSRLLPGAGAALAFSADGKRLASAGERGLLTLWDVALGRPLASYPVERRGAIGVLAWSPDGRTLALGDSLGSVALVGVDPASGHRTGAKSEKAHDDAVTSLVFSPDGTTLASGSLDRTVAIWDVDETQPLRWHLKTWRDAVDRLAFSADGTALAAGGPDGAVVVWEVPRTRARNGAYTPSLDAIAGLAFDPTGQSLALASEDSSIWLWDVVRGRPRGTPLRGHDDVLTSVVYSADGRLLASGGEDLQIRLWDAATGIPAGPPLTGHAGRVSALAFSPDGAVLASGGRDSAVMLWDVSTGAMHALAPRHAGEVTAVAFSPDGRRLVSASRDQTFIVWDRDSRRIVGAPVKVGAGVNAVAFVPPDGRLIVTGGDAGIQFWNAATGAAEGAVDGRPGRINSLAVEPSGRLLAAGGRNVTLWSAHDRKLVGQPFESHESAVNGVAFRPDGRTVASAGVDRRLIVWDADVANWPRRACAVVNRDVRADEWPKGTNRAADTSVCRH